MIILIIAFIVVLLFVIAIYNRGRSEYPILWDKLELSKSDKLESNGFTIVKNLSLMNHNKEIVIPAYFRKPIVIVDSTQILCLRFKFGNYVWINFAGTYLGATLLNAFDIRYSQNVMDFKIHSGFYRVYKQYIKPRFGELIGNNKKIIISGYSLGGVLAVMLLCDLIHSKKDNRLIKCMTYGTPKFGCKDMYDYFSKYDKLIRVEYDNDKIPKFSAREFYNIGIKKKFNLDNNIPGIINTHYYSYETFYNGI